MVLFFNYQANSLNDSKKIKCLKFNYILSKSKKWLNSQKNSVLDYGLRVEGGDQQSLKGPKGSQK